MNKYISFFEQYKCKDGKIFQKKVKFSVQSSDLKWWYVHGQKIDKSLQGELYEIGEIIE